MKKRIIKISFFVTVVVTLILVAFYCFSDNITFKLNGDEFIRLQLNQSYNDDGFVARLFKWDISNNVKIQNDLEIKKIGKYNIEYTLNFFGYNYVLNRQIEVIDNTPPTIELIGEKEIKLYVGDSYNENGAIAIDDYDKDLTDSIKIEGEVDTANEGKYEIKYYVKDSSGNENSITRVVIVEKKIDPIVINIQNSTPTYDLNDPIVKYIKDHDYKVSIGYYNLETGREYYYQENKSYYGASLIKTLDAIYLYDNNLVNDTLKPYVNKAISRSDNSAHNYLINYIGKSNLSNYGKNLGAKNTLNSGDNFGYTTVKDQLVYWKKLYEITKTNEELKSYFINDLGNYIEINNLVTMHKYGYYGQYYHDVGIIYDNEPYIIIVLTNHGNDNSYEIINDISNLMYKYHLNQL